MYVTYDSKRTSVKGVDYVPSFCDDTYMATVGETLLALKQRASLPLEAIASRAGYRGKSSIQEYFKPEYVGPLGSRAAQKLADGLAGAGTPPIDRNQVLALASLPASNAQTVQYEGSSFERMSEDLPIVGTALGGAVHIDGEAIEQTMLNRGEIIGYAKRPTMLNGREDAYGLYVQGSSMVPVHSEGAFLVVERKRPPRIGDDVVVYLRASGQQDEADDGQRARAVLLKRLVRRTASYIELEQFNPPLTFKVAADDAMRVDRVMDLSDLLT